MNKTDLVKNAMLAVQRYPWEQGVCMQALYEFGIIHEVCGCPDFVFSGTSAESMAAYLMMHAWKKKLI